MNLSDVPLYRFIPLPSYKTFHENPSCEKKAILSVSLQHFPKAGESNVTWKEEQKFYADLSPSLGIPLSIKSRLQTNIIIRRDPDIDSIR